MKDMDCTRVAARLSKTVGKNFRKGDIVYLTDAKKTKKCGDYFFSVENEKQENRNVRSKYLIF